MIFGQDRDQIRALYCGAWQQHISGQPLEPLQAQIVAVIELHPEYQGLLEKPELALGREYAPETGETNPFLHMGMHLAIREQIGTDRPAGIRDVYRRLLLGNGGDSHALDHRIMECLAEMIWHAQREGEMPDEARYLACIEALDRDR